MYGGKWDYQFKTFKIHPKFHLSAKDKGKINAAHYSLLIAQQIAFFHRVGHSPKYQECLGASRLS